MVGSVGEELEFLYDIEFGEFGDADALNVVHCGEICCAGRVDEGTWRRRGEWLLGRSGRYRQCIGGCADRCH